MDKNKNDENLSDKTDELIEDREEQKKLVHPYRKYQLFILAMLIFMIIFIIILYKQNCKLKVYLKEKDLSLTLLTNIEGESKSIKQIMELIDINYKCLNKLDEVRNIDIIRTPHEINTLSAYISDKEIITYEICYKSSEDGDSPTKFLEKCAKFVPLVFLIETTEGYRFAVYINQFLNYELNMGKGGYIWDNRAFIYSFDTNKKYNIKEPDYAIHVQPNEFPWFGKKDVYIGKDFTWSYSSFSEFPAAFERNDDDPGDYILNGGIKKFNIKEMEVLCPSIWDYEIP